MTSDDDLDELWGELRRPPPPRPKPSPPPPPQPFGGMPFPRRVHVGLLRDDGNEVNAPSYARTTTLLKLEDPASGRLSFDVILFPNIREDWGAVVTVGFYQDDGEALFYLDLAGPINLRQGDDLRLNSPGPGLFLNGVRPPS